MVLLMWYGTLNISKSRFFGIMKFNIIKHYFFIPRCHFLDFDNAKGLNIEKKLPILSIVP